MTELSSVRILTADVLLQHRPYEVEYRGDLPEPTELSDEQWAKVESGMEQQIFDLTNVMRNQQEKSGLEREKSDRKSTRLNSSHVAMSYTVLCWKTKKECSRPA